MDRQQHQRFLTYLKKYEYFGRGLQRLGMADFTELEAEIGELDPHDPATESRRHDVLTLLLRD